MVATAGSLSWSPLLSLSPPRLSQPAAAALPRYLSRRGTGVCASTVGLRFFSRFSPPFSRGGASPRAWGVGRSNVWRHGGEAPRIVPVRPSTAGPSPAALPVVPVLARRRRAPLFRCLSYPLPFFPRPLPVPSLSSLSSFLPVDHFAGATPQAGGAPPTRDPPLAMRRRPWRMVLSPAFPAWWGPPPPLRLLADVAARAGWSVARPRPRPLPPSFVLSSDTGRRSPWRWHPCMWATGSSVGGLSSTLWP